METLKAHKLAYFSLVGLLSLVLATNTMILVKNSKRGFHKKGYFHKNMEQKYERVVKKLNLPKEKENKINSIIETDKEIMKTQRNKMKEYMQKMREEIEKENTDKNLINEYINNINKLMKQKMTTHTQMIFAIKDELELEQFKKFYQKIRRHGKFGKKSRNCHKGKRYDKK